MSAALSPSQNDWLVEFPPPRSLPLDQEALRIYERAYAIGLETEGPEEPPISFTTVAIALLVGEDETSRWFADAAKTRGPNPNSVLAEKSLPTDKLPSIAPHPGRPAILRLSSDKQLLTTSAQAVLGTAEEWATRVGASDIGVRHLVASYVLNPPTAHRQQMVRWGFDERAWRGHFFEWISPRYTAESWSDASGKVAPTKAIPAFERPEVKGAELAFDGDPAVIQILRRAAEYHRRRSETWLRLQTVFFALIEEARTDYGLQQGLAPIWKAALAAEAGYGAAFQVFQAESSASKPPVPFDDLDISPRVLNGLETARELTLAAGQQKVSVLAFAGALISRRVDGDEDLGRWGFDPSGLRRAVIEHAVAAGETHEIWRDALGEEELPPIGRTLDLNSDEPEAVVRGDERWISDPLGIRGDVASFATLIASKSLEPPLSIGLFGPWGAGKTTFLKRLRRAIDDHAAEARTAVAEGRQTSYVGEIVHVEFNAWHFAETVLISSLVDTVVRALQSHIKDNDPPVGAALETLKKATVEQSLLRVESAKQAEAEARNAVATATATLQASTTDAANKVAGLNAALQATWTAALAAARQIPVVKESGVLDNLEAGAQSLEALRAQIESARVRPARMLTALGWAKTVLFAALVLALPAAAAWVVHQVLGIESVSQAVVALSAGASVVLVWLRAASTTVAKIDEALATVAKEYNDKIRADPKVKHAELDLTASNAAAAMASETLAAAQAALQQAQADLDAVALPAQMMALISSRMKDRSYTKELTTVSTARGDLQLLSRLLREQAAAGESGAPAGVTPVERVILYVDDLDRCKPEDVVKVLQVVHMLLAFELFIVVVAVDARWVDELLKQTYRWLTPEKAKAGAPIRVAKIDPGEADSATAALSQAAANIKGETSPTSGEAEAAHITPQDYLEKIFQISFWLEPMNASRAAEYLKSLVRTPHRESGGAIPPRSQIQAGRIEIMPIELDYMRALAAYVGPSPRRVKRLVNAYRLLKARLSDTQLDQFLTDRTAKDGTAKETLRSGPYQLVIGLLVIGTGAPSSASEILTELAQRDPGHRLDQVITDFRARKHPDWATAAQVLEMLMRTQKSDDISELRGWASKVGRFLLQGSNTMLRQRSGPIQSPSPQQGHAPAAEARLLS